MGISCKKRIIMLYNYKISIAFYAIARINYYPVRRRINLITNITWYIYTFFTNITIWKFFWGFSSMRSYPFYITRKFNRWFFYYILNSKIFRLNNNFITCRNFIRFLNIIPLVIVSGSPPLLEIITAQPRLDASRLVLPKGSSHLEQTTAMLLLL